MGFSAVGEVDGYYGPLTAEAIGKIKLFLGFDKPENTEFSKPFEYFWYTRDGKIEKTLWDIIFNKEYEDILKKISVVSKYDNVWIDER